MFKKKHELIGLDIGSTAIKLAVLKQGKEGLALAAIGSLPLTNTAFVDDSIMDSSELSEAIKNLLGSQGLSVKADVATALSARTAVIRVVEMDLMSEEEIEATLELEGETYIASDITGLFIDFQVLETFEVEEIERMKVLVVAAKQESIDEFTSTFKSIGMNPVIVDLDCFAAINATMHNYDLTDSVAALIHVGHNSTTVSIVKNGIFHFSRSLSTGGNSFRQNIIKELSIDDQTAAEILSGSIPEGFGEEEIKRVIKDSVDTVAFEIRRSFDFLEATNEELDIDRVFVTGGMTNKDILLQSISKKVDKPVERVDPFRNIEIDEDLFDPEYINSIAPAMVVAVGLALRGKQNA